MGEPLWTNLRATKAAREPYIWHIEGIWNHEGDPEDPESWGWVADVNEAGPVRGSVEGDTAKALAHRYNVHAALVVALEGLTPYLTDCRCGPGSPATCGKCQALRARRAALQLARGEL